MFFSAESLPSAQAGGQPPIPEVQRSMRQAANLFRAASYVTGAEDLVADSTGQPVTSATCHEPDSAAVFNIHPEHDGWRLGCALDTGQPLVVAFSEGVTLTTTRADFKLGGQRAELVLPEGAVELGEWTLRALSKMLQKARPLETGNVPDTLEPETVLRLIGDELLLPMPENQAWRLRQQAAIDQEVTGATYLAHTASEDLELSYLFPHGSVTVWCEGKWRDLAVNMALEFEEQDVLAAPSAQPPAVTCTVTLEKAIRWQTACGYRWPSDRVDIVISGEQAEILLPIEPWAAKTGDYVDYLDGPSFDNLQSILACLAAVPQPDIRA